MLIHHQGRRLLAAIHLYQRHRATTGLRAAVGRARGKLGHAFWTVISGSDIDRDATIAPDVKFPHPNGVVIHQGASVASGVMIMQQVTLGQIAKSGAPRVGANSYIGAGAKVLGNITIGDNVQIGANAVVLCDVPDGATAVGVPARIILKQD